MICNISEFRTSVKSINMHMRGSAHTHTHNLHRHFLTFMLLRLSKQEMKGHRDSQSVSTQEGRVGRAGERTPVCWDAKRAHVTLEEAGRQDVTTQQGSPSWSPRDLSAWAQGRDWHSIWGRGLTPTGFQSAQPSHSYTPGPATLPASHQPSSLKRALRSTSTTFIRSHALVGWHF